MFLNNGATLLEIQPDGMECTAMGQQFARGIGVTYVPFRVARKCVCEESDLVCYLENKPKWEKPITDTAIRDIVDRIVGTESG
jgi:hypothetical protein